MLLQDCKMTDVAPNMLCKSGIERMRLNMPSDTLLLLISTAAQTGSDYCSSINRRAKLLWQQRSQLLR